MPSSVNPNPRPCRSFPWSLVHTTGASPRAMFPPWPFKHLLSLTHFLQASFLVPGHFKLLPPQGFCTCWSLSLGLCVAASLLPSKAWQAGKLQCEASHPPRPTPLQPCFIFFMTCITIWYITYRSMHGSTGRHVCSPHLHVSSPHGQSRRIAWQLSQHPLPSTQNSAWQSTNTVCQEWTTAENASKMNEPTSFCKGDVSVLICKLRLMQDLRIVATNASSHFTWLHLWKTLEGTRHSTSIPGVLSVPLHSSSVPHCLYSDYRFWIFLPCTRAMIGVSIHMTWPILLKTKYVQTFCQLSVFCLMTLVKSLIGPVSRGGQS